MKGVARREVLKTALCGAVLWPQVRPGSQLRELNDIEGRPVRKIADSDDISSIEREHLIEIEAPEKVKASEPFRVTVRLPDHPAAGRHHITWLRLYVDSEAICYMTFAPIWQRPETTVTLTLPKGRRLDAVAECSLHGLWGASAPIEIEL